MLAIVALVFAWVFVVQTLGWADSSHYALVRSLSHGTPKIDRYHWETRDVAYRDGHYYSVKGPALAALTLPLYEGLKAVDAQTVARRAATTAREHGSRRWEPFTVQLGIYGYDFDRAVKTRKTLENETPMVWALRLLGATLPALLLLLLVRSLAERVERGFGTAAAVTLGLGTLVMPFATLFFSHLLAALLAFAAFAVLWREREGPPRLVLLPAAGALAGLAVTAEYPLALGGVVLGLYAIARRPGIVRRGVAYAGGAIAGAAPLLAYNVWAFGSATHFSYSDAVKIPGGSGHDVLGLNDGGFFGIRTPTLHHAEQLLVAPKGLLTLSPVLAMAAVGTVLLYRRGRRAEALAIGGMSLAYLIYNSGYYLPFGGGSPGARFLIPILPFLAVSLALAYRRFPATTIALAAPSAAMMVAATAAKPLLGNQDAGFWADLIGHGDFEHTLATLVGAGHGFGAIAPFALAAVLAGVLAARATPVVPLLRADVWAGAAALVAWVAVAAVAPDLLGDTSAVGGDPGAIELIAGGAACGALALSALALTRRGRAPLRRATPAAAAGPTPDAPASAPTAFRARIPGAGSRSARRVT